jgi:hypothetical protein
MGVWLSWLLRSLELIRIDQAVVGGNKNKPGAEARRLLDAKM